MADGDFPQIDERQYLADYYEGEALRREQEFFGVYRLPERGPMNPPPVEAEGSWLQRQARKR